MISRCQNFSCRDRIAFDGHVRWKRFHEGWSRRVNHGDGLDGERTIAAAIHRLPRAGYRILSWAIRCRDALIKQDIHIAVAVVRSSDDRGSRNVVTFRSNIFWDILVPRWALGILNGDRELVIGGISTNIPSGQGDQVHVIATII